MLGHSRTLQHIEGARALNPGSHFIYAIERYVVPDSKATHVVIT